MTQSFDLAVIGAGPAGMEAAVTASEAGLKTVVIDSFPQAGGQYYKRLPEEFKPAQLTGTEKEGEFLVHLMEGQPVTRYYDTLVWGIFKEEKGEGWLVSLYRQDTPRHIHARFLILASGAYDTPVAFPGWTLPGVMTCGAALTLLKNQRIFPGKRVLVTGTGPLLLSAAAHIVEAGAQVPVVCEANRPFPKGARYLGTVIGQMHRVQEGARYLSTMLRSGVSYRTGWSILAAHGTDTVEEAVIGQVDENGVPIWKTAQTFKVDTVVSGYSLTPNVGLARLIGCQMEYQPKRGGWVPVRDETMQTSLPGVFAAGDGSGIGGAENARLEGRIAGAAAAVQAGKLTTQQAGQIYGKIKSSLGQQRSFARLLGDLFSPQPGLISLAKDDTILCRCEEITLGEVKEAVQAGARTMGEVKMITRTGMGNCQGRMCEHSVAAALHRALSAEGVTPEMIGSYAIRPPLHPVPVGYLAESVIDE